MASMVDSERKTAWVDNPNLPLPTATDNIVQGIRNTGKTVRRIFNSDGSGQIHIYSTEPNGHPPDLKYYFSPDGRLSLVPPPPPETSAERFRRLVNSCQEETTSLTSTIPEIPPETSQFPADPPIDLSTAPTQPLRINPITPSLADAENNPPETTSLPDPETPPLARESISVKQGSDLLLLPPSADYPYKLLPKPPPEPELDQTGHALPGNWEPQKDHWGHLFPDYHKPPEDDLEKERKHRAALERNRLIEEKLRRHRQEHPTPPPPPPGKLTMTLARIAGKIDKISNQISESFQNFIYLHDKEAIAVTVAALVFILVNACSPIVYKLLLLMIK